MTKIAIQMIADIHVLEWKDASMKNASVIKTRKRRISTICNGRDPNPKKVAKATQ